MPEPPQVARLFNALNGQEVKDLVLKEIKRQLDADCNFRHNLTYPVVSWEWKLTVKAYPREPGEFTAGAAGEIRARIGEDEASTKPVEIPVTELVVANLAGGRSVEVPDAERQKEGLPLPEAVDHIAKPHPVAKSVTIKKDRDVRTPAQRERE